jgi:hypothetical protein
MLLWPGQSPAGRWGGIGQLSLFNYQLQQTDLKYIILYLQLSSKIDI